MKSRGGVSIPFAVLGLVSGGGENRISACSPLFKPFRRELCWQLHTYLHTNGASFSKYAKYCDYPAEAAAVVPLQKIRLARVPGRCRDEGDIVLKDAALSGR